MSMQSEYLNSQRWVDSSGIWTLLTMTCTAQMANNCALFEKFAQHLRPVQHGMSAPFMCTRAWKMPCSRVRLCRSWDFSHTAGRGRVTACRTRLPRLTLHQTRLMRCEGNWWRNLQTSSPIPHWSQWRALHCTLICDWVLCRVEYTCREWSRMLIAIKPRHSCMAWSLRASSRVSPSRLTGVTRSSSLQRRAPTRNNWPWTSKNWTTKSDDQHTRTRTPHDNVANIGDAKLFHKVGCPSWVLAGAAVWKLPSHSQRSWHHWVGTVFLRNP